MLSQSLSNWAASIMTIVIDLSEPLLLYPTERIKADRNTLGARGGVRGNAPTGFEP